MDLACWWMFPLAIVIASFATTVGVGGPVFFSPIFIVVFGMPAPVAFGTALVTQSFGFASGVYGYARQKMIDFKLGAMLLITALPFAVAGSMMSQSTDGAILELVFAIWVIISAAILYWTAEHERRLPNEPGVVINKYFGYLVAAIGGLLVGLISTGMGNILVPWMNVYGRIPIRKTIATCMFVIFATVLVSAASYAALSPLDWNVLFFAIPGVLIGGQIGPRISERIDPVLLKKAMSVVFVIIGMAMLAKQLGA